MKIITIIAALTLIFMLFDIVTGLAKACKNGGYKSSKMREGLYHKGGYIACIMLCALIEVTCEYVELGFHLPILKPVMVYIILNEVGSIIENIEAINPDILPKQIRDVLHKPESEG